ncbi:2-C-methyl-D-erythritol 4-phosphate cytidylyltransferase [Haematomicrobium sanguinis]|uniref:2-C-methyl-D-erythritol 4-phosphate cytidylyltransferase n=1 Tax=Haematomicrobium sanguinis TaxID=479106 RepID=UPI00047A9FA5|nr:2-C-methyl-D-erythritol 4-phosphate cytidylyltransferase [Haematomicrobium sanguinis]
MNLALIVVAAGLGQRLGAGIPKAQVNVGGREILGHVLDSLESENMPSFMQIVIAVPPGEAILRSMCAQRQPSGVVIQAVDGGGERADSVRNALGTLDDSVTHVLIHDAARALTPAAVFSRVCAALEEGAGAVIPAVPVVDTIKSVSSRGGVERVESTLNRANLRAVQTPQGFALDVLRRAHELVSREGVSVTDDAAAAERLGEPVVVVAGDPLAFKITAPMDLMVAEAALAHGEENA